MKETIIFTELVNRAANGDNKAFEELYHATVKSAFRTANLILSNPNDAEDVVQNAYIKASKKLPELKNPESFENWLKSIVENECKNYIRKEKRIIAPFISLKSKAEETAQEPAEAVPQEIMEREDLRNGVTEIINSLSSETRACIVLFHYEDKSLNEISEILNIPVGTVKSRLYNGRKKIEKQFEKLRKKEPTLYGISAIPLLLSFIAYQSQKIALPVAISSAAAVTSGTAIGTTASTSAGATAATAAATGATATATATTAAATTATTIAVKATAVIVAGSLAVGGTAVIKNQIEKTAEQTTEYSSITEETGTVEHSENNSSESFSKETNSESSSTQNSTNEHTSSLAIASTVSLVSNKTTTVLETETRQTTVTSTQKPTETTSKPTTQPTTATHTSTTSTTQLPTEATQQSTTNPENNYSNASGVITEYTGRDSKISIPSSIGSNTVTAIGVGAFQGNTNISSVSLPNTVTQIGQEAFADCTSLSSVSLPPSLKQIGIGAFYGCSSLSSITIPDSVTTIGDEAFANCTALKTVTIPSSVTDIADDAFSGCNSLRIICPEGSVAHKFAVSNSIEYTITN